MKIMTTQLVVYWICVFQKNHRLIAIDLSKQTKSKDTQQNNFIGKHENQDHRTTIFFIIENAEETAFELLQTSVSILEKWERK